MFQSLDQTIVTNEKTYPSFDKAHHVKCGVIHKIYNFLFGVFDDSAIFK